MSETTNLKLFKHDNPSTNTDQFDIEKALNENWDKVDGFAEIVNDKIIEIEDSIKDSNTLIKDIQDENTLLKSQIPTGTIQPTEYVSIKDSANMPFKEISIGGNHHQDGTPTTETPIDIKSCGESGSISINKSNKNLASIENGNLVDSTGAEQTATNCVRTNFIPFSSSKSLVVQWNTSLNVRYYIYYLYDKNKNFISSNSYLNGKIITTSNEDIAFIRFKIYGPTDGNMTVNDIDFQVEEGEVATTIIKHEGETYIIPLQQQAMLTGDYFDFNTEEEVHIWKKKILDGTENFSITTSGNSFRIYIDDILRITATNERGDLLSNTYAVDTWNNRNTNNSSNTIAQYDNSVGFDKGNYTTVDEFKAWLEEKYNEGNPVYIWYKAATETRLAFTEEQNAIWDEIEKDDNYKNITIMYSEDEIKPIMSGTYYKDRETTDKNYEDRIAALEAAIIGG